jgi:tRNA1(Val) A37 N6-methylase TrmN6
MANDAASDAIHLQHDELTDDALAGDFRILQRRRGHRYSIDDVLTAYQAARISPTRNSPPPKRYLDLGCGIGSVLLMVAYKYRDAAIEGIEAQEQSFSLATQNVQRNRQQTRVTLHHGDLRDTHLLDRLRAPFDLITGTPPYQPPGTGTPSPDSQAAASLRWEDWWRHS